MTSNTTKIPINDFLAAMNLCLGEVPIGVDKPISPSSVVVDFELDFDAPSELLVLAHIE